MNFYLGEFEVAMDAKGRFMVPAAFRKQLPEERSGAFVLKRGMEACLELYTKESWVKVQEQLSKMNDFNPKVQKFKRLFLNGASLVELDSAGRLLVPKPLQEYAGMSKELLFSAKGDKVEIWERAAYYKYMEAHANELDDLATEVWGDSFVNPFES